MPSIIISLISFCSLFFIFSENAFASFSGATEVLCSVYGTDALSCDQCFDGGTDYVGDDIAKAFDDTFLNGAGFDQIMLRGSGLSTVLTPLQPSVGVGTSSNYGVAFVPSLVWLQDALGQDGHVFLDGYSEFFAGMVGGVLFTSVSAGANPDKPALRYDYITNTQQFNWSTFLGEGTPIVHKECAFVKPRWCGDNIISNGEVCDDGAANGQPGKCNTACTEKTIIPTTCNNLTVSTTTGTAPTNIVVSCNATNATNYRIDCGNGFTNLTDSATCHYMTGGTFTPTCYVDGSITSPSCTKSVTINTPPPTPLCSTTVKGPMNFPVSIGTPNICDVGSPIDYVTDVVGMTSYYTWNCKNGDVVSPQCSATYTPPASCGNGIKEGTESCDDGANNGQPGMCKADCTGIVPIPPLCDTTKVGTISSPISQGYCNPGSPTSFNTTTIGTTKNYSWSCNNGGSSVACSATYTPPASCGNGIKEGTESCDDGANNGQPGMCKADCTGIVPIPPLCDTTKVGTISSPISQGYCNPGSPTSFNTTTIGTTKNYSWSCNNGGSSVACSATYTPPASCGNGIKEGTESCDDGANNGQPGMCKADCTGIVPIPPLCDTTKVGTISSPISQGYCNPGSPTSFNTTTIGTTKNYSWSCNNGGSSVACSATYTPPASCGNGIKEGTESCDDGANNGQPGMCKADCTGIVPIPPLCDTTKVGTISSPISQGYCNPGSPTSFNTTTIGTTKNYSWSCNNGGSSVACSATYTPPASCGNGIKEGTESCDDGANNGQPGMCKADCTGIVPIPPLCDTTKVGTISSPISQGYCNPGSPTSFNTTTIGTTKNYSWSCNNGGSSVACSATYTPPASCGNGIKEGTESCDDGANNGQPGMCKADCTGIVPIPPLCDTTKVGTISSPISQGYCNPGSPTSFNTTTIGTTKNYSWSCNNGGSSVACSATYTPPASCGNGIKEGTESCDDGANNGQPGMCKADCTGIVPIPPLCDTTKVGTISSPISQGYCNPGSPTSFNTTTIGTTKNYSWSCNNGGSSVACSATYTPPASCGNGIKEGTESCDDGANNGQPGMCKADCTGIVPIPPLCDTTKVGTISSPISQGYCNPGSPTSFNTTTIGTTKNYSWSCNNGGSSVACSATYTPPASCGNGIKEGTESCDDGANNGQPGMCKADCTGIVPIPFPMCNPFRTGVQSSPLTQGYCTAGSPITFTQAGISPINYSWSCSNALGSVACTASYTPVIPPNTFNLSVKKYIGTDDAESAITTTAGASLTYNIVVRNTGSGTSSGTTTLQDILPTGVNFVGTSAWNNGNWNCTHSGTTRTVRCTNSIDTAGSGTNLGSTISIPVSVTATVGQTIRNIASIDNPYETGRCTATGALPPDSTTSCTLDIANSDPAYFTVSGGGGGGGGVAVVGKICINGVATCANYKSSVECSAAGAANCRDADLPGQVACQALSMSCPGPGGGGGGGGGGFCGDGVLQSGEECDIAGGTPWCQSCKLKSITNPGSNPDTAIWMTIPLLSKAQLGYPSWFDGVPGKIQFENNTMVLGNGTKAFTLADTVGFGISKRFTVPIMIEADKEICLKSSGPALNSETLCTTFGNAASLDTSVVTWTRYDGQKYVILGNGEFQYQTMTGGPYYVKKLTYKPNNINLFKGSRLYKNSGGSMITLNSAFNGRQIGDGWMTIATTTVPLVSLPVRVSGALVGTTSTPVNRSIENFISQTALNSFLASIRASTSLSSTTTNTNTTSSTANINLDIKTVGPKYVTSLADMSTFTHNGNQNILAVKGDLTLVGCPNNTFIMNGVRTIIVEGNLTIKCNIIYNPTDTTSSFAWIVKGGNIYIDGGISTDLQSGVIKLSGIYVAVKQGSTGGEFRSIGDLASQHVLRVDGSLYGYAKPLLDSRLYARGTSAYEILTTGTILTYSNRALVNPPPLLSEYLRNYNVQRIIR